MIMRVVSGIGFQLLTTISRLPVCLTITRIHGILKLSFSHVEIKLKRASMIMYSKSDNIEYLTYMEIRSSLDTAGINCLRRVSKNRFRTL